MIKLLQQVRVLDGISHLDGIFDVLIVDGYIQAISPLITDFPEMTEIQDCRGLILGPGLVELYSHTGEPGFEERETLLSLKQAAIAGGFTRIAILPDMSPPLDNPGILALIEREWKQHNSTISPLIKEPQLYLWGALTMGIKGEQMTEIGCLATSGVVGFADGLPIENRGLLRRLLEYIKPLNKPIALWCCDQSLAANGVMRESFESLNLGLPGNPGMSETVALAGILELVESIHTPIHIMRVSTKRSVELIQDAKARGLPITASVTWMHLLLDTEMINHGEMPGYNIQPYDPNLRLEPPLGTKLDRLALIAGIKTGIIDGISIEHTPYTYEEKVLAFAASPPGVIGLELALPLLWENLVLTGELSGLELWQALSTKPTLCLQQIPISIAVGQPAEVTLFDPNLKWKVARQNLKSLADNTPWFQQEIRGRIIPF
jgi:dihydroorotase